MSRSGRLVVRKGSSLLCFFFCFLPYLDLFERRKAFSWWGCNADGGRSIHPPFLSLLSFVYMSSNISAVLFLHACNLIDLLLPFRDFRVLVSVSHLPQFIIHCWKWLLPEIPRENLCHWYMTKMMYVKKQSCHFWSNQISWMS